MRLRWCACGAPVVLTGRRVEDDRPTGRLHAHPRTEYVEASVSWAPFDRILIPAVRYPGSVKPRCPECGYHAGQHSESCSQGGG